MCERPHKMYIRIGFTCKATPQDYEFVEIGPEDIIMHMHIAYTS